MPIPTLLELAESGAHFGHHRSFVYPKAREFVYDIRHNVALIDLEKTQQQLAKAQKVFSEAQNANQTVLFVGTKRGIREAIKDIATSVGAAYVVERWLGGFLSNFETISTNIKKMNELDEFLQSNESKKLTKIERLRREAKLKRYHRFLAGVTELKARPDLLVMASANQDKIALSEAKSQNIPVIAICDTDTNPDLIDYPIPANDDATRAVELILRSLVSNSTTKVKPVKVDVVAEKALGQEDETTAKPGKVTVRKTEVKSKKAVKVASTKAVKPVAAKASVKKVLAKKTTSRKAKKNDD